VTHGPFTLGLGGISQERSKLDFLEVLALHDVLLAVRRDSLGNRAPDFDSAVAHDASNRRRILAIA
jgi:hypothetical protein